MGTQNRVLSITAHGSTVKSPPGLGWLGSVEKLLVQKLSNIWSWLCALTVCCTGPRAFVWLSVLNCREITSNLCANQRISTRPDPRLLHSCGPFTNSFGFFPSFLLPSVHPPRPSLTLFPIFSYRTPAVVYFFFLWETVQLLCTGASALLISLFCHFLLFQYFGRSILTLPWFRWIYSWNMKLYRYAWYIYCIYYSCAPFFPLFFSFRSTNYTFRILIGRWLKRYAFFVANNQPILILLILIITFFLSFFLIYVD